MIQMKLVSDHYSNRFLIPFDFELLKTSAPFHQNSLKETLTYNLTFNDLNKIMNTTKVAGATATCSITNLKLIFTKIRHNFLATAVMNRNLGQNVVLFDNVIRHFHKYLLNKNQSQWVIDVNRSADSVKGILMLFKEVPGFS